MFPLIQKWHKKFGVISALFVIFLAASGIILNHSQQLNLNTNYIQNEWLLALYDIKPANDPVGFVSNNLWSVQVGERLYFDKKEIAKDVSMLKGLIKISDIYVVAYDAQLTLLTPQGEVIEHLSGAVGVPAGMQNIGVDEQSNVIIKAAHGYYRVDLDVLEWKEFDSLDASWSTPGIIPENIKDDLLKKYRGFGLTLERVLQDFHSGRIVGQWGVYIVDFIAILFLILALSGVWMWSKR
ncbi:MAG: hypothetical protein HND53_13410 [Proteobacteria bacterium]|nr:PepSY domain-containing protein [Pseudomonadota bacterium]NOG61495.1 hypothetical protein [Pseudomonadota bacterium]